MVVDLVSPHAASIPESTPIFDQLVHELGQGMFFWPELMAFDWLNELVRTTLSTLAEVLGVTLAYAAAGP